MWAALPGMTEELIADIMEYRAEQDFNSVREVQTIVGPEVFRGIAGYLTTETTPYYTIRSTGRLSGSRVSDGVTAVVRFDPQSEEKYQIIEWTDEHTRPKQRMVRPAS